MDNLQAMVLTAVKLSKEADLEAISARTRIPLSVVRGVCRYLTRYGYLTLSEGRYKTTSKATRALYDREREVEIR